jgi:O-antigen/teichoic acid export membrane protein
VHQQEKKRLLHRAFRASSWTMLSYGATLGFRFFGNLLLTRLLFPEAFGTMAIVQTVLVGINMLSDIGVEQAIVQNKAGDDPSFVSTAWTLQILRGLAIWIACCALAFPVALIYKNPSIGYLLPAIGLTALVAGFASPNLAIYSRRLAIAPIALLEIASSALAISSMVFLAWLTQSIWALIIGNMIGSVVTTSISHVAFKGARPRFSIDRDSLKTLLNFGGWIFASTSITFMVGEGNRLLIGSLLSVRDLAFFSLASTLAQLPFQITQQLGARVLLPAYSEVLRERPERFYAVLLKVRAAQVLPTLAIGVILILWGQSLVSTLYDARYAPVAPMLSILVLGTFPQAIIASYGPLLVAKGMMKSNTFLLMIQLFVQAALLAIGALTKGTWGLLIGLSLSLWIVYPFYARVYARLCLWQPRVDLAFSAVAILISSIILLFPAHFGWH